MENLNENIKIKKIKKTENMIDYMKQYRKNNKEHIKQYYKDYCLKKNPNEKFICGCGGSYTKANKSIHQLTNKHLKFMIKENDNEKIIM